MRKSLFLLVALGATPLLHAQRFEVYGNVTGAHLNNVATSSGPNCIPNVGCLVYCVDNVCRDDSGPISESHAAAGGGITLNFLRLRLATLGVDVRGSRRFGTDGANLVLGGLKLTIESPLLKMRPYIQGSAGYLGTASPDGILGPPTIHHDTYGAAEVLAGLDLPLTRLLDLRLIEIGAGHALSTADFTKPTFVTASAGLVVHFQSLSHKISLP